MKREPIDFFLVADHHVEIHSRLCNWSRWVKPALFRREMHPMWQAVKSDNWERPVGSRHCVDTLDGLAVERGVSALPDKHREAIKWAYVTPYIGVRTIRQRLGVTAAQLQTLLRDGRQMLLNRRV